MRRINYLLACMVAVMTFAMGFAVRAQQEVPRPDLLVRGLAMKSKSVVTVYALNRGQADAVTCDVMLSGTDSAGKKWSRRYYYRGGSVARGATVEMVFDILPHEAEPGTRLSAEIDSAGRVAEENETNNMRDLVVPVPEVVVVLLPTPTPRPTPIKITPEKTAPTPHAPAEKLISPDIAAVAIRIEHDSMVGELKNVGDRHYQTIPKFKIKDSFRRIVTLQRIVYIGGTSYTEDIGTSTLRNMPQGHKSTYSFPRPKFFPVPKKYIWILTIDGEDPNTNNNTFKWVQTFNPID